MKELSDFVSNHPMFSGAALFFAFILFASLIDALSSLAKRR